MTHRVVSDTHRAAAEYLRTPYWLNPCVLSRKMPNQLPELQEVELSIIVLDSSELTGRSAAAGSAAFCRGGKKATRNSEKYSKESQFGQTLMLLVVRVGR